MAISHPMRDSSKIEALVKEGKDLIPKLEEITEFQRQPRLSLLDICLKKKVLLAAKEARLLCTKEAHPPTAEADVIMALAGSNGGSWSTAFSPKSAAKLVNDSNLHSGENAAGLVSNVPFPQELHGKLAVTGSSSRAVGPGDHVSTPTDLFNV